MNDLLTCSCGKTPKIVPVEPLDLQGIIRFAVDVVCECGERSKCPWRESPNLARNAGVRQWNWERRKKKGVPTNE